MHCLHAAMSDEVELEEGEVREGLEAERGEGEEMEEEGDKISREQLESLG